MLSRRLFNVDSKTPLENLCLSHEELKDRLSIKDGLQSLILENNRDHIISGKQYNTAGYVLQLIEHLGRRCTVGEVVAASDGDLTERSVSSSITKINGLLYALVGVRLTLDKETSQIRMVNDADALMATEKFAGRMTKAREEFVRTATAYEQATGKSIGPVLEQIDQQLLAQGKSKDTTFGALRNVLTPAAEEAAV
tara:strand:+ start:580 stop:1167 length:588 start_codon:yes stop_codon:yes gene_type:complete